MKVKISMKHLLTIIISATVAYATLFGMYNYLPIKYLTIESTQDLGATITTILATDKLSDSRSVINTNFTNLNNNKIEMSTTSVASITTLSNLVSVGTFTTGATGSGFTVDLDTSTFTCSACILSGDYAAASIDGDDLNTNIAGRSLTLTSASPDVLDADVELYTYEISATLMSTTTGTGIATTSKFFLHAIVPVNSTITGFTCKGFPGVTGTSTVGVQLSTDGVTAGTEILYSTGVDCGGGHEVSTSTFEVTALSAGDTVWFYVQDGDPEGTAAERLYPSFTVTKDD